MKNLFLAFLICLMPLKGVAQARYVSEDIKPYMEHIEAHGVAPVDYVMDLFRRHDVVILCEASHLETTAYDLIGEILSDRRFIDSVGCVMTEVGSYVLKEKFAELLTAENQDDAVFEQQMLLLARNLMHQAYWEKTNYYGFLKNIRDINKGLPAEKKIRYIPTDIPFSWNQTQSWTSEDYNNFAERSYPSRDEVMASNAITELIKMFDGDGPRKKALIILNSRHAYQYYDTQSGVRPAAGVVFAQFPGRVANVMLHDIDPDDDDREEYDRLKADGKWDAAFAAMGNPPSGFDLEGSPFGMDTFESWIEPVEPILYQDVFTGYIFYKSPFEWEDSWGYDGLVPEDFADEVLRRLNIFPARGNYSREDIKRINNVQKVMPYKDQQLMKSQLGKYYR
jgi:hypothetical protein